MLLEDVATFLQSSGCGTVGTTIWRAQMPDDCNAGISIHEYPGAEADYTLLVAGVYIERPRFQLYCRHTVRATGRSLIETAYLALATVVNQTLTSTKYLRIEPLQQPGNFDPPQDVQGRWEWFCNFQAEKEVG
jgi:hypothetical protein